LICSGGTVILIPCTVIFFKEENTVFFLREIIVGSRRVFSPHYIFSLPWFSLAVYYFKFFYYGFFCLPWLLFYFVFVYLRP